MKDANDILLFGALPPCTICTMIVGICPYTPPLLLGGNNHPYPSFQALPMN
jgi:hypothetical protein